MGLVPAKRAGCNRAHAIKKKHHFPETLARLGHFCRKLSMSGQCGWSLTIRCEKQARVSPKRKGSAQRSVL